MTPGALQGGGRAGRPVRLRRSVLVSAAGLLVVVTAFAGLHVVNQTLMNRAELGSIVRHDVPTYRLGYRALHLGRELSLPAWFSSLLIAANGLMMLGLAWLHGRSRRADALAWAGLGVLFVFLSADEAIAIHEVVEPRVRGALVGEMGTGVRAALLAVLGLAGLFAVGVMLPWFLRLPGWMKGGLVGAFAIFILGAVGLDVLMQVFLRSAGETDPPLQSPPTVTVTLVVAEEACEMLGMALLACLLWARLAPQITLRPLPPA